MDDPNQIVPEKDPVYPPWGIGEVAGFIFISVLLSLIVPQVIYSFAPFFIDNPEFDAALRDPHSPIRRNFIFLTSVGTQCIILLVLFKRVWRYGMSLKTGFCLLKPAKLQIRQVILMTLGLTVLNFLVPRSLYESTKIPIDTLVPHSYGWIYYLLLAITFAPLYEELLFRGYMFPAVAKKIGTDPAILIVAAVFVLCHVPLYWGAWIYLMIIFLLGLFLTQLRAVTGSTLVCIIAHFIYNLASILGSIIRTILSVS